MAMQASFQNRLTEVATDIEGTLAGLLGHEAPGFEVMRPVRLLEAMRYAVLAGGKRLRPFLVVETARLLGKGSGPDARWAAAAVELVHCYSLVHDDLPSMDDDDLRRGRPTVHKAYDEATAILAGDALQSLAFAVLADPDHCKDAGIRAELVLGLAQASGLGGMVGGQVLDLAQEGRYGKVDPSAVDIRTMQAMKTGALISFSVQAGAILCRADAAARAAMKVYGEALGVAFQIADDLLDVESTAEETGKNTGKDAARGKVTLIDRLGVDAARAECQRLLGQALEALEPWGHEADILRAAARFVIERRA